MKKFGVCILALLISFFLASGVYAAERKITAFCGTASELPMEEAAKVFERKTGIKVELNWGGSGAVLSQLKLSRRGDLFIPGCTDYMTKAIKEGLVEPKTVKITAYLIPAITAQPPADRPDQRASQRAVPSRRRSAVAAPASPIGR